MMLRSIRKGVAYGWYTDKQTYNVYFKDADNDISFKQHEQENFEYLNVSKYNTPLFPLSAINEFFAAPHKEQTERDVEGHEHTFFINMVHIEFIRYVDFFAKHLPDFSFNITHQAHKSYALTVTTNKSLYQLLHVVSVLCLFFSMFGNEFIDITDSILDKYIKSLKVIDAPFYIRSLFVRNFLTSKERFQKYKAELEETEHYEIRFAYGNTALQRRNYIGDVLRFDKSILDVGCGEGFYANHFAGKIEGSYYAIDINEMLLEKVKRTAAARELDNIVTFNSIDRFLESYNGEQVDVILTEVIEHMGLAEAQRFFSKLTTENHMEAVVIKPEMWSGKTAPYMKVRNPEYLSIIYGYDYQVPDKYRKLLKQKNIKQKLRTSLSEYRLGLQMLKIPFDEISPEHQAYQEIAASLLFEVAQEREIDPRL